MSTAGRASGRYPAGTVRALLETDLVTARTRDVLRSSLEDCGLEDRGERERDVAAPRFFDARSYATLRAVCARLIPQPERAQPIDLARQVDARLADGLRDGWRYDVLPPDGDAYRRGLHALDESARAAFAADFAAVSGERQDLLLATTQRGEVGGAGWTRMMAVRFFEELLAELAECYYSHPLALDEIGYAGFADAHGWQAIGLNVLEPHEPREMDDELDGSPDPRG